MDCNKTVGEVDLLAFVFAVTNQRQCIVSFNQSGVA